MPSHIPAQQPTSFVLSLKNNKPGRREDGRRESALSYEFRFDLRSFAGLAVSEKEGAREVEVVIAWDEFIPTYRGREQKGKEVDPSHIVE